MPHRTAFPPSLRRKAVPLAAGALLALTSLFPGAVSGADPETGADAAFIDDQTIIQQVEAQGNALIRAGKATKMKALRSQLQRVHSCALTVPERTLERLAPAEIYERRSRSVLIVGVLSKNKKRSRYELAGCSGFALTADGVLVTNYHVVDSPEGEAIVIATRDGQMAPVMEVLAADKLADVAILRAPGLSLTPAPLASAAPAPGSPVWVISHPDHNFFSFTSGQVSRLFMAETEYGRTPQMAITADFGVGSSGGPILDSSGCVTGMVCSTTSVYWEDDKGKVTDLQMVLKHCVPVGSIRRLIEPATAPSAAGE